MIPLTLARMGRVLVTVAAPAALAMSPGARSHPVEPTRHGAIEMAYPYPAPDGTSLFFQANYEGRWQIYRLDLESDGVTRVSQSQADDVHPAVSPDGRQLAIASSVGGTADIVILDLASGERRVLVPHPGADGHPKWSADGTWITFNRALDPSDPEGQSNTAIMRVRPDGSGLAIISDSPNVETFPSFDPTGERVAFIEWFREDGGDSANGEIVIVDLARGERTRVTNDPAFDGWPIWGPSGKWIYFSRLRREDGRTNGEVLRISHETGQVETVTPRDGIADLRGVPGPDESRLYYNNGSEGRNWIVSVALDHGGN